MVLPIFWLIIVGVIGSFQYVGEAYAVGQAAEAGVVTMANGGNNFSVQRAVATSLARDGYGLSGMQLRTNTANSLASVEVLLPIQTNLPMMPRQVGETRSSQLIVTKGGGSHPGPWW